MQNKILINFLKEISIWILNSLRLLISNILKKLSSFLIDAYNLCTSHIETPEDGMGSVSIIMLIIFLSFPFLKQPAEWLIIMTHTCVAIAALYTLWGWKYEFKNFVRKYFFKPSYRTLIIHGLIALALVPVAHGLSKSYIESYINISTGLSPQYFPNSILIFNIVGTFFSYLTILVICILAMQVWYSSQIFLWCLVALGKTILLNFKKPNNDEKQKELAKKPTMLIGLSSFLKMAVCFYIGYFLNMVEIEELPHSLYLPGKVIAHKFDHLSISSCSGVKLYYGQRIKKISSSEAILSIERKSTITFKKIDCNGSLLAKSE